MSQSDHHCTLEGGLQHNMADIKGHRLCNHVIMYIMMSSLYVCVCVCVCVCVTNYKSISAAAVPCPLLL